MTLKLRPFVGNVVAIGAFAAGVLFLVGCATVDATSFSLSEKKFPPKPVDHKIEIFTYSVPDRPFERIARLNFHSEKTFFVSTGLEAALRALKVQAREAGGDALIELNESRSMLNETRIYNVSATAIVYGD